MTIDQLDELESTLARVAADVGPSVVGLGRGWERGSGVVISRHRVLTCAHSLRGDETTVLFADGRHERTSVAAVDGDLDLAVLSVPTGDLVAPEWGPAASGRAIGAPVVAAANPGGRGLRVTLGHVSSAGQSFRGPRGRRIAGGIEHTAPLPRGSSGAPLLDPDGRLLGINALRREGGLILAVPAAAVRERVEALARGDAPRTARLGVAVAPARAGRRLRRAVGLSERDGVLVRAVEDDGPAARAGIRAGDLIVAAGDGAIVDVDGLYAVLDAFDPEHAASALRLTIVRGDDEREVEVPLGAPGAERSV